MTGFAFLKGVMELGLAFDLLSLVAMTVLFPYSKQEYGLTRQKVTEAFTYPLPKIVSANSMI